MIKSLIKNLCLYVFNGISMCKHIIRPYKTTGNFLAILNIFKNCIISCTVFSEKFVGLFCCVIHRRPLKFKILFMAKGEGERYRNVYIVFLHLYIYEEIKYFKTLPMKT